MAYFQRENAAYAAPHCSCIAILIIHCSLTQFTENTSYPDKHASCPDASSQVLHYLKVSRNVTETCTHFVLHIKYKEPKRTSQSYSLAPDYAILGTIAFHIHHSFPIQRFTHSNLMFPRQFNEVPQSKRPKNKFEQQVYAVQHKIYLYSKEKIPKFVKLKFLLCTSQKYMHFILITAWHFELPHFRSDQTCMLLYYASKCSITTMEHHQHIFQLSTSVFVQ